LQMPEHEAIIEGETGAFYKYGSVESLTDVIEDWIQNRERIAEARENCRERIHAHFHVDYQVDAIMDVLDQLVENRNES
ncbi:MAG: glycosyltransferase, partial [Coraliomargarita sp.]